MPPTKSLVSVSPSQTKTAHTCPTKWWAEKRLGLRSPSTPATRFGGILHAVVECYLLQIPEDRQFAYIVETTAKDTGANEPVTKQEVGRAWGLVNHNIKLGLLPAPGEGRVEGTVKYAIDGVPTSMNARFDWLGVTTHPVTGRLCPLVVDHKTTSSPNYAETEETLADNDQAIIYGEYGLRQMPEADYVCVRFVYYQTKDRKHGWIVEVWLTRNEVERKYRDMVKYIAQMCAWYEEDDINKIPREVSNNTCRAYNRDCAAIGVCPAHVSNKDTSPASAASAWVQSARNASVKPTTPKKESSSMSVAVINEAKYAPTFRAIITKKFADQLGINEDQAQVMLAEFESKTGWTQDPEVQAARLPVEAAKAGARIIQKRAATKASVARDVAAVVAPAVPKAMRQLTADELDLIEQLKTYEFPADEATAIVRKDPDAAQKILNEALFYSEWAEMNDQPDLSEEREEVQAPPPKAAAAPKAASAPKPAAPKPAAPKPTAATTIVAPGGAEALVAVAEEANPAAIKKFRKSLERLDVTLEQGIEALLEQHAGKTLSEKEAEVAVKTAFGIERLRAEHVNAVMLCLACPGDTFVVPGQMSASKAEQVAFKPLEYLQATWPALAKDAEVVFHAKEATTPEGVRAVVVKIQQAREATPVLQTSKAAAALVSGAAPQAEEKVVTPPPAPRPAVAAPAPAATPEPAAEEERGYEDVIILVDAFAVNAVTCSLDAVYEECVDKYIQENGTHPMNTKFREGVAQVTEVFRQTVREMLADTVGIYRIESSGDAYRALNGVFGERGVVIMGRR